MSSYAESAKADRHKQFREHINECIFTLDTYMESDSRQYISERAKEITTELSLHLEKGAILAVCHQARGHWVIRLKTPDQVKQLINIPINISNQAKPLTITPRRKHLLITLFADPAITNEELVERITKYGNVMKIAKGYYDFDGKIEDGRRLIFLHPKTEISEIPHFIYVDGLRLHLHFKGKVVHCRVCDQKHPVEGGCIERKRKNETGQKTAKKGMRKRLHQKFADKIKPNTTKENPIRYTTNNEPRLITTERTLMKNQEKYTKKSYGKRQKQRWKQRQRKQIKGVKSKM